MPNEPIAPRITTSTPGEEGLWSLKERIQVDPIPRDGRAKIPLEPADGDAVPMLRVAPRYPERALARGIEGRVLVERTGMRISIPFRREHDEST